MKELSIGELELRFAELIWSNEPVPSSELVRLAERELSWKKSTTYTVLRRLCDKGIFANDGGKVRSLMSRDELMAAQSRRFVESNFSGSLPMFLAAFSSGKKLSDREIAEIQRIIDENRGQRP